MRQVGSSAQCHQRADSNPAYGASASPHSQQIFRHKSSVQKNSDICCTEGLHCYIPHPLSKTGSGKISETINRQLFFVWQDNAFEFDLRPMTTVS